MKGSNASFQKESGAARNHDSKKSMVLTFSNTHNLKGAVDRFLRHGSRSGVYELSQKIVHSPPGRPIRLYGPLRDFGLTVEL